MDKNISQSDKDEIVQFSLSKKMSLAGSIRSFANMLGYSVSEENTIDFQNGEEQCFMSSIMLNDSVELGYFNYRLKRTVRFTSPEEADSEMISLNFNFGSGLLHSAEGKEEVTNEGITNSIIITNGKIRIHTTAVRGKQLHMLVIRYKKQFLKENFRKALRFQANIVEKESPLLIYEDFNAAIIHALRSMELHKIPKFTRTPFLLGKSYVLLALVVEMFEERDDRVSMRLSSVEFEKLLEVKKYIVADWKRPPTIQQVSEFLGMSPTKAKVLFKQTFGKPIYTYFQQKRMAEALRMINEGEHTIAEIGHFLGYRNLGHFAESFKKQYGILPKKLALSKKRQFQKNSHLMAPQG